MKHIFLIPALLFLAPLCVKAEPSIITIPSQTYKIHEIGSSIYIEPSPPVGAAGVTGALIATGVAASLQTKPIQLEKNTDFACNYQKILTVKLRNCSDK